MIRDELAALLAPYLGPPRDNAALDAADAVLAYLCDRGWHTPDACRSDRAVRPA